MTDQTYATDETSAHHIPWLHGAGKREHAFPDIVAALTDEMRRVNTTPGATGKSPMPAMRAELRKIWMSMDSLGPKGFVMRGQVFSTLDILSITTLLPSGRVQISVDLWNEIAAHLTPEIIDAFCERGNNGSDLNFLSDGAEHPSQEVMLRIIAGWNRPDGAFLKDITVAARLGQIPASIALAAMQHRLDRKARWPIMDSGDQWISRDYAMNDTMLRVLGVLDAEIDWAGDTWRTRDHADLNRVLDLTRSRHGQLKIIGTITNPETLFSDPEGAIRRLIS